MSKINLERLTIEDLVQLQKDVVHHIGLRREQVKSDLKKKFVEMASASGVDMAEFGGFFKGGRGRRANGMVKYRNPKDPSQTWTGRGRKPNWLVDAVKKGAKLAHFLA